jgi:ubiquinone/menaquinone biosynthesis C-methylase UbiE
MVTLNIAPGPWDDWGDVRLDISKVYHGQEVNLNILGDAHNLPFRDNAFEKTRAFNILEHLEDWRQALSEWCRVSKNEVDVKVPIESDLLKHQIWCDVLGCIPTRIAKIPSYFYRLPERRKEHLWQFKPAPIMSLLEKKEFENTWHEIYRKPLFPSLARRKHRLLNMIGMVKVDIGYVIHGSTKAGNE